MRIVELPTELSPNGRLAASPLVEREHVGEVGWSLAMFDGYSPDGAVPPESYRTVATGSRFALRGRLAQPYGADTFCADEQVGAFVTLEGPDTILEWVANPSEQEELLAFVDDEVMAVLGAALVAPATWQVFLARSMFGTARAEHVAGSEVYIARRDSLAAVQSRAFIAGTALKFKAARFAKYQDEFSDADATDFSFTGAGLALPPANLRVNGRARDASFAAAADVILSWSQPYNKPDVDALGLNCRTFVEILKTSDSSRLWAKKANGNSMKILGAKMTIVLGGQTEFDLRLSTDVLGDEFHLNSQTVTIRAHQI